ncbi:MAG: hypothetical protein IT332_03050 [Ardenticatenales bacterium]|nr:hypothetical protein [Ardenticatenales bacterium]
MAAAVLVALVRAVRCGNLRLRREADDVAADAACAVVIALGVLRLGPAVPWPAALDGGWYAAAAVRIAHDRSLFFDAPAAAVDGLVTPLAALRFEGIPAPDDRAHGFHAVAFAVPRIGVPVVTPYHPPLFASLAALGVTLYGPYGSADAARWSAALWLLAIAALARTIGLRAAAPAATALAALSPQFRVYGATPYAELFAGALALAALVALGVILRDRLAVGDGAASPAGAEDDRTATGTPIGGATWLAAAAGAAVGTAVVAKIDLLPFALATAVLWLVAAPNVRTRGAFVAGAALPAAALIALFRGPTVVYAVLNGTGVWRLAAAFLDRWGLVILLGAIGCAAFAAVGTRSRRRRRPGRPRAAGRVSIGAVAGATVLAAAVWQARPSAGEPTGMVRLLAWSVTPLGLFGAAIALGGRVERARRVPAVVWPLVAASAFVLAAPIVTRDLSPIYAARRLAPIAVPTACLLAALCIERAVAGRGAAQRAAVAAVTALGLAAAALQSGRLRPSREFAAAKLLIDRIAGHAVPGDLVLFPSPYGTDLSARLAAPLWALHDVDVAVLPGAVEDPESGAPGAAAAALTRWSDAHPGGRVLWVAAPSTKPPAGMALDGIGEESLITEAWQPGIMPPGFAAVELTVGIGALTPAVDNSR